MKKLKINFVDFFGDFDKQNNIFWDVLSKKFDLEISESPDLIFFSVYTLEHYKYDCLKIFYTAEDIRPNFNKSDFAITFDYLDDSRHYRLPLYVLHYYRFIQNEFVLNPNPNKNKFCNFIYTNPYCKPRNLFFKKLNKYKKVDSGGRHLNNLGYTVGNKLEFINNYKFTIAFENASTPGYTTEKIIEPFMVKSIPIYWGNPLVASEFNPESFINVHDYTSFDQVVEKIKEIDEDEVLYNKYKNSPMFKDDKLPDSFSKEKLSVFLEHVVAQIGVKKPVAKNKGYFIFHFIDIIKKKRNNLRGNYRYYSKRFLQTLGLKDKAVI